MRLATRRRSRSTPRARRSRARAPASRSPISPSCPSDVDEDDLREALAALQAPLGDVSSEQEIAGVDTRTLQVSPTVAVTYAIVDGLAIAATSPDAISALTGKGGLDESERYEAATEDFPDEVSLIGYVNLQDLVALGEELGLA